jgi:hypothetical protein
MCLARPTLVPMTTYVDQVHVSFRAGRRENRKLSRTFGLELPAKPAFKLEVPTSMTTGWFNSNEAPESPPT